MLTRSAEDVDLAAAITTAWPMMREYTITVGKPDHVLAAIDWDRDVATAEASNLYRNGTGADTLTFAIDDARCAVERSDIVDLVRQFIADNYADADPAPVAVMFGPDEFDNGWFLTGTGVLYFADGTTETDVYFGIDSELSAAYGVVGSECALGINLRTGDITFDDYVSTVEDALGLSAPSQGGVSA